MDSAGSWAFGDLWPLVVCIISALPTVLVISLVSYGVNVVLVPLRSLAKVVAWPGQRPVPDVVEELLAPRP
eukprot:5687440-Heterocapsa_arctica.AAC.1